MFVDVIISGIQAIITIGLMYLIIRGFISYMVEMWRE